MVGVLHTWTRDLASHPPRHDLVLGGTLAPDGFTWLTPRSGDWLVPVHALSTLFRGTFRAALTTTGLLAHVPPQGWTKGWLPHGQPAGTGAEVRADCAPSLYRIALTHNRLAKCDAGAVTCRVKARTRHVCTYRTLPAEEFLRRFLQYVLPKGCSKVRSYGVLSPSRRPALAPSRALLAVCPTLTPATKSRPPGTVMSPVAPRRGPGTAKDVVGHSSSCAVCCPEEEGHRNGCER